MAGRAIFHSLCGSFVDTFGVTPNCEKWPRGHRAFLNLFIK